MLSKLWHLFWHPHLPNNARRVVRWQCKRCGVFLGKGVKECECECG